MRQRQEIQAVLRFLNFVVLVCGALLALCLPKPGLCPLAWLVVSPFLFLSIRTQSYSRAARMGWLFGFAFWGTALYWIYNTCRFAGIPIPAAVFAWAAACAVFSLSWAVFATGARWAWRAFPAQAWPWACAVFWTALEFAGDRICPYFGALPLGYTQWRYLSWIQNSSWAGPHGLGFLIMLVNAALALGIEVRSGLPGARRKGFIPTAWTTAGIVLAWWVLGSRALADRAPVAKEDFKRAAILQPNVDQYHKWDAEYAAQIRSGIGAQVRAAQQMRPDLILWPEASLPGWLDSPENAQWLRVLFKENAKQSQAYRTLGKSESRIVTPAKAGVHNMDSRFRGNDARGLFLPNVLQAYQLIGTLTRTPEMNSASRLPDSSSRQYNSAVLFDPGGEDIGEYHKRRLVPFGEFVPWRPLASKFIGILDQMGDLDAGAWAQAPLPAPMGRLGVTICYEAVFPEFSRWNAAVGADVLVNLTNDGWYKDTWGPYQHFYVNIFRAVENRRPVLRAANTGISGVIDPYGEVTAHLDLGRPGVLVAPVPVGLFPEGSFYSRHGDWFGWANLAAALAIAAFGLWKAQRETALA